MKDIEKAKVVFFDTGNEYYLHNRCNSICHFFQKFKAGGENIQLRLDWSDRDANGYPTLDADFYNIETGKKRKLKGKRKDSHHTKALENEGRTYEWEFRETNLKFKVLLQFRVCMAERIFVSDSCSAEVVKAKK